MDGQRDSLHPLLEQLGTSTAVFNEDARIVTCTSSCASLFGLSADKLLGQRMQGLGIEILDESGELELSGVFPLNKSTGNGSAVQFVFGLRRTPGTGICWFSATLKDGTGDGSGEVLTFLTLTDITSLVRDRLTNSQIFQAKSEWETTVDALQDIVTIQDTEMRIVRANKAAHDLFGFQFGELKGKKCHEVFFGKDVPCNNCPLPKTVVDGCPHMGTVYNPVLDRTFSVSSFPNFSQSGEVRLLVHVARDVTLYLQNESEKNRLMAAIEQASESVVISTEKGVIQYVNPAFENSTGYTRAEAIGKRLNILKSGVHDRQFYDSMWQTLLNKQVWRGRLTNRRKNGTLFKEDATISPVLDSSGNIINYVALKRDVTREELLEQQLHQALKMEALGTLAGGIAHDFNNILAAMIGYGEIARSRLGPGHPARKDIDQVLAGGDRAVDLVKQILTFSRRESYGQFRLIKMQYIVKEIIKLLRPSLPATIELVHEIDTNCRSILADPGQIYQVLMNLCTNARQSIGEDHGRITIRLSERYSGEGADSPGGAAAHVGSYLDLEVTDTGCGIEEERLAKIFDPFYTTKKIEQGTGLGLAVVHGIIKKHKGEIHVTSKVGAGTTFHVYLAVDGRDVENGKKGPPVIRGGHERIMIVDDEVPVATVLKAILEDVGYQIETFHDSIAAVKRFRENPGCCDMVLTDMLMPNMTGAELAREFLALRPELPIIMLTGHSDNFDTVRAKKMGIRELILKPARKEKLQQMVRRVLEHGKDIDH